MCGWLPARLPIAGRATSESHHEATRELLGLAADHHVKVKIPPEHCKWAREWRLQCEPPFGEAVGGQALVCFSESWTSKSQHTNPLAVVGHLCLKSARSSQNSYQSELPFHRVCPEQNVDAHWQGHLLHARFKDQSPVT